MINYDFTAKELTRYRKEQYWRGFVACLVFVVAPIVLGLVVLANIFINNNI